VIVRSQHHRVDGQPAVRAILEGEVDLTLSGVVHSMKEGDVIIMSANEAHALKAVKPFKMLLTMVRQPEDQ